jgi:hypothetical protein
MRLRTVRWRVPWKVLGVAGLAGVAATGAIIARDQRQRAQLTPEEVRARLRARVEQQDAVPPDPGQADSTDSSARA